METSRHIKVDQELEGNFPKSRIKRQIGRCKKNKTNYKTFNIWLRGVQKRANREKALFKKWHKKTEEKEHRFLDQKDPLSTKDNKWEKTHTQAHSCEIKQHLGTKRRSCKFLEWEDTGQVQRIIMDF